MRTVSGIFLLLLCRRVLRCSELHSHLLLKFRNQHIISREGAVTVKILSSSSREKDKELECGKREKKREGD